MSFGNIAKRYLRIAWCMNKLFSGDFLTLNVISGSSKVYRRGNRRFEEEGHERVGFGTFLGFLIYAPYLIILVWCCKCFAPYLFLLLMMTEYKNERRICYVSALS